MVHRVLKKIYVETKKTIELPLCLFDDVFFFFQDGHWDIAF